MSKPKSKFAAVLEQKRPLEGIGEEEQAKVRGKRTNPTYTQVTAYIPRSLHGEVKIALIREGKRDFSTLVEDLLSEWTQSQKTDAGKYLVCRVAAYSATRSFGCLSGTWRAPFFLLFPYRQK